MRVCQRSSNHKLKAIHNDSLSYSTIPIGVSKIVKSQIESNSQQINAERGFKNRCVKDRQITNWKQFTTIKSYIRAGRTVCQRSSNHKLKAIHNHRQGQRLWCQGVSKIVKSQIESNSQLPACNVCQQNRCVKDRQITNWKQFTTLKQWVTSEMRCVKDRQITNWKQFTTPQKSVNLRGVVCQRSSNHKLKAIHNIDGKTYYWHRGVSKIVKSQIESNSQPCHSLYCLVFRCVKDRQITNWKQFTTRRRVLWWIDAVCQRSSNHKLKAIHNTAR